MASTVRVQHLRAVYGAILGVYEARMVLCRASSPLQGTISYVGGRPR